MKNLYCTLFLIMNSVFLSHGQHLIKDSFSNEKIAFVEIYSDNGNLIGITDINGLLSIDLKNKITAINSKYLILVNSFYENKVVEINDFKNESVFKMEPIVNELKEVVISPKKNQNKYLILRTYVRSLQINNDKIHYYIDGIVEYYISLKSKKVKMKFLSNRSFENKSIKQLKEKGLKVHFQITGAPMLHQFLNYNNLKENYNFQNTGAEIKITSKEENSLKGNFFMNNNGTNLSLGIITNDKPKIMKGLGVENILFNYSVKSLFNTANFEEIDFDNLLYFKEIRSYVIKNKKDKNFQKVDGIHEVFVLDYRYSEEIDAEKLDQNYSFKSNSSYKEKYWEKVNNILFQPLAEPTELFIKENLIELK